MKKPSRHRTAIDAILFLIKSLEGESGEFAKIIDWEIRFFDRLTKEARARGSDGIRKVFHDETKPYAIGGWGVTGGGEERWLRYFWGILYPEDFVWSPRPVGDDVGVFWHLMEGRAIGEREKAILFGMLTSVSGLAYLFDLEKERFRNLFADRPTWPEGMKHDMEILLGSLSFCASPSCGTFFVGERKGQKFCSDACRKKAHGVPSASRKDPKTIRIYFYRKVGEGYSRETAWASTLERHGKTLEALGLNGSRPPASWAKNKEG